jgi:hypothetical protein
MRAWGILTGAAILAAAPAFAADTGAVAGTPMQPGSAWGHGGPAMGAPMMAPPPAGAPMAMAPPPGAWHGSAPQWHGGRGDYHHAVRGWRVPKHYRDRGYVVADWRGWGFGQPGPGMNWIRYYDDALLIDADGRVVDCRYGVNWDGPRGGYAMGGPGYGYPPAGAMVPPPGYAGGVVPGTTSYRAGPNTTVTTTVTPMGAPMTYAAGGCGACGGTIVTVTPGMAVTTTTTTTDYETVYRKVAVRKRAWHRPIRRYHPRCVQKTCPVQGS